VMGGVAWLAAGRLEAWLGAQGLLAQLATGLLPVLIGVVAYALAARWLKVPEAGALLGLLGRPPRPHL
jgi:hypothetical protein